MAVRCSLRVHLLYFSILIHSAFGWPNQPAAVLCGYALTYPCGQPKRDACSRFEQYVRENVVGQDLQYMQNMICSHLASYENSPKPALLMLHGPTGTGKSYVHQLLAQALHGVEANKRNACKGIGTDRCYGYQVLQAMNFAEDATAHQLVQLKETLDRLSKTAHTPFIVVQDYDKIPCKMRLFLLSYIKDALHTPGNAVRSIFIIESNLGFAYLETVDVAKVSQKDLQGNLIQLTYKEFSERCNTANKASLVSFMGAVDLHVPFFPMDVQAFAILLNKELSRVSNRCKSVKGLPFVWNRDELQFLVNQVQFTDAGKVLFGAPEAKKVVTTHVFNLWKSVADVSKKERTAGQHVFMLSLNQHGSALQLKGPYLKADLPSQMYS